MEHNSAVKQVLKPCIRLPASESGTALIQPAPKFTLNDQTVKKTKPPHGVELDETIYADNESNQSNKSVSKNEVDLPHGEFAHEWDVERQKRETWSGKMDFILSCVGYAVGLSNVWRFPYLCYRSGGGAFLVPYFFFLVVCGMPLVILEVCLGQFASLSAMALYQKMCPIMQGMGISTAIVSGLVCVYYNIIITWALYYLILSFRAVLPWTSCGNWWNTENCVTKIGDLVDTNATLFFDNSSSVLSNETAISMRKTASEEFWVRYVLRLSPGLGDLGPIQWRLFICLVAAWVFIFLCLCRGVKSSGRKFVGLLHLLAPLVGLPDGIYYYLVPQWHRLKEPGVWADGSVVYVTATFPYLVLIILMIRGVTLPGAFDGIYYYLVPQWHRLKEPGVWADGSVVYVTATFPYLVLIILMIRGVTLPGAFDGIYYYLVPQWHRLKEPGVWADAASQIFFSVGPGWGTLITMSSYNRFRHNCYRDALILPLVNCSTSLFAGIVVFSIIGFMARESGRAIKDVITSGPGLAFIVYPEALSQLPISPLWAVLFFIMLITIGVDTQFAMFETLISACVDTWPALLRRRKVAFTAMICVVMFFLGLPCVTQGGMYVLQLMDWYSSTFTLMFISMSECVIIYWIYGYERFIADIKLMVKTDVSRWWSVCWGFISPVVIFTLLITSLASHTPVKYNDYVFPGYGIALGWMLSLCSLLPTPIMAVKNMVQAEGSLKQKWLKCLRPTPDWGPSRLGDRVMFRKSFAQAPSKQLYVLGVEKQEEAIFKLALTRQSYVGLEKFVEKSSENGNFVEEMGNKTELADRQYD